MSTYRVDSELAARVLGILVVIVSIMATAYVIARTVKTMCLAAAARSIPAIDAGVSTLFFFVMLSVILGGILATQVVLFPRRKPPAP